MKNALLKSIGGGIASFAEKNGRVVGAFGIVTGVVVTAVLAYRCRPSVDETIKETKEKLSDIEKDENLTEESKKVKSKQVIKEGVKKAAPAVAPVVAAAAATSGIAIGTMVHAEHVINKWMNAAAVGEVAYNELYAKTREIVGDEKTNEITQKVVDDKEPIINEDVESVYIFDCGGNDLFYDFYSGRPFRCKESIVQNAVIACNRRLTNGQETYISLNEFYQELGLPTTGGGDDRGWGGFTMADRLEPNLCNTMRWGEGSCTILDWYVRPMLGYKGH